MIAHGLDTVLLVKKFQLIFGVLCSFITLGRFVLSPRLDVHHVLEAFTIFVTFVLFLFLFFFPDPCLVVPLFFVPLGTLFSRQAFRFPLLVNIHVFFQYFDHVNILLSGSEMAELLMQRPALCLCVIPDPTVPAYHIVILVLVVWVNSVEYVMLACDTQIRTRYFPSV